MFKVNRSAILSLIAGAACLTGGHRAVAAGQFAGTPISGGASAPFTAQSDTTEDYALT